MKLIRKQWFLVCLIAMLATGFWFAPLLENISEIEWLKWSIVTVTMFLMAWPLSFGRLKRTFSRPAAPILACVLNLILIPLLIWPMAALAGTELGPGMIVAAATPSTLASAAVMTRRAGGNDTVSIMVTIFTNSTCFLVIPFWIMVQTGNQVETSKLVGTIYKLFVFVVLPIAVAQFGRNHSPSAAWATRRKPLLSFLALLGILAMVFIGAIKTGLRLNGSSDFEMRLNELLIAASVLLTVHVFVFWFGIWISGRIGYRLGIIREDQIAIGFSGSQKTLMIGLATSVDLGVSIIPIVLYHAMQLIVDSIFAEHIRERQMKRKTS